MKLIPTKYLLIDGAETPNDTEVKACCMCNRKFAVPKDELDNDDICCEDCESEYNKKTAADSIKEMKDKVTDTASNVINAALGN